jgi:hypothetical protein
MTMTPERFQLISQIYREALECDHTERVAFLERQCGRDRELRHDVESLLSGGKSAEACVAVPGNERGCQKADRRNASLARR